MRIICWQTILTKYHRSTFFPKIGKDLAKICRLLQLWLALLGLTHLCGMEFPTIIKWTSFKGCWIVFFIFIQMLKESSVSKTVKTLIRRSILLCLVWVCTVCTSLTKRTLGLNGLRLFSYLTLSLAYLYTMYFNRLTAMCTTRGERRLISIWC